MKREKQTFKRLHRREGRGFALITSLAVIALLALVSIGLLSLSTVELRSSGAGESMAKAKANAQFALKMAMAELQKSMGPDQRVSANAGILEVSGDGGTVVRHPHWTGVWDSWQAGPADPSTIGADFPSHHQTIEGTGRSGAAVERGMNPTYEPKRADHFRSWLVSLTGKEAAGITSPLELELEGRPIPKREAEAVRLVGPGSLGPDGSERDFVSARLLELSSGRYGWWVGDESQKARLMDDPHESAEGEPTFAEKLFRHQSPGSTGTTSVPGLEHLESDAQLASLPSLRTLDLVKNVVGRPSENFHTVTPFSFQVLADVREGGLKRDLTTLLERPIKEDRRGLPAETGEDFMLYKFKAKDQWARTSGQEQVPIHDLAAFYQLYNESRSDWDQGVMYSSNLVKNGLHVKAADYGTKSNLKQFLRHYSSLYRNPVPIKLQFLLSMKADAITPAPVPTRTNPTPPTHKLYLGITPSITLWNPTNLPLVMNFGNPDRYAHMLRLLNMPLNIRWVKNGGKYRSDQGTHMTWATQQSGSYKANVFSLYFSGTRPIVFEPGEVRVFSLPYREGNMNFRKSDRFVEQHEVAGGWDPSSFLEMHRSDRNNGSEHVDSNSLLFRGDDKISFEITADNTEIFTGPAMAFFLIQTTHQKHGNPGTWHFRQYHHMSRVGSGGSTGEFNKNLLLKGFPSGGTGRGGHMIRSAPRSGSQIIARSKSRRGPQAWPFLQFGLKAGTETHEDSNSGAVAGRKFVSRPFLHSTAIAPSFIDQNDHDSFYHYGWNWWVEEINSVLEANVQVSRDDQGYYGGGYTPESGTTHVVQQEIPVVPPISLAALSHAHLGGFSIATEAATGTGDGTNGSGYQGLVSPYDGESYHHVTAAGQGGLFPHTLQAIGNSYAHPYIPADKAFTTWRRTFSANAGAKPITVADHSYLANKALWDDYFFSSIHPIPSEAKVFGGTRSRNAESVAQGFFFADAPLPNSRMTPYLRNLDENRLKALFKNADKFRDGLADKIASNLMVEGPFNVNSTSVEAWKVFLSSLKGKSITYLDKDTSLSNRRPLLDETTPEGTPVGSFSLPNGEPVTGSTTDPSENAQWSSWRELTDEEIEELAVAIVKQVKLRGPFLSLSDFVNRRLDANDKELSLKGALQAALDDKDVSINEGFRASARRFSSEEVGKLNPKFPEALEGPVAYGSAPYIDQADVLRNFAAQLTPRGDTFVIRTYGDAVDRAGNVTARAWCEAVVQRVPEYLDPSDEPHLPQAALKSEVNKSFGRKLRIVSFRWLNPSEV